MLTTRRLTLTHFRPEHAEEFTRALNDPRIFEYLPESVPDLADIRKLIQWFMERDKANAEGDFVGTNLAIVIRETGQIIGWCGLQPFEPYPDKKEIFYGLSPVFWNKGYMTEAVRAVLTYGFDDLGLPEIVAGVKPENTASIAVLEKTGFVFRGILDEVPRGSEFYLGERYYSLTRRQ